VLRLFELCNFSPAPLGHPLYCISVPAGYFAALKPNAAIIMIELFTNLVIIKNQVYTSILKNIDH